LTSRFKKFALADIKGHFISRRVSAPNTQGPQPQATPALFGINEKMAADCSAAG
jgi:hypothetical protein